MEHFQQWLAREASLIEHPSPLLAMAILLVIGYIATKLAHKFHIPAVTMQIVGGIIIGHYVLNIFSDETFEAFRPITSFALGFIGFAIGSHLNLRKLHNSGKRILFITITDVILTPAIVFVTMFYLVGLSAPVCHILAALSMTTAPGSVLHTVKEKKAKGVLTKTILAVVALNNVITILLFYFAYYFALHLYQDSPISILKPLVMFLESAVIGTLVGFIVIYFTEKRKTGISFLIIVVMAIIVEVGVSETIAVSGVLASLFLGMVITNFSKNANQLFGAFRDIEEEVFALFFVLAGTHVDFPAIKAAGLAGVVLILVRIVGKSIFPILGAYLAGASNITKKYIGISLYPIAGVAIGLVLTLESDPFFAADISNILAIILTTVVASELIGPVFMGKALDKANESHMDRMRLMDFIQEEFITVNLRSTDKWDMLEELAEFLYRTHDTDGCDIKKLKKSVIEREKDFSTGIGEGLAIPHAVVENGPSIIGVIGISQKGIEFDSLDGEPVHILFMIATPKENYHRQHLQVLSNIAKIFGHHPHIKEQMINSKSAEEVYEVLHREEIQKLNPFFEDK
jgi:fructose PTS system EIIBC or EIIC component